MTFTVKGHQYRLDGEVVPSVTTILDQWPKQLTNWAARQVAGFAVDHWDELAGLPTSERLHRMQEVVKRRSGEAMLRGSDIHQFGEALVAGHTVDVPPQHLGPVQAYARWLDQWQVTPLVVERPILNRSHWYAGRPDLLALVGPEQRPTLVDIKTGGSVYESAALQVCAYGRAEVYLNAEGEERTWARPELYAIAHVGSDGVDMRPVEVSEETWRTFLYLYEVWKYGQQCRDAYREGRTWPILPAVSPAHESTAVSR